MQSETNYDHKKLYKRYFILGAACVRKLKPTRSTVQPCCPVRMQNNEGVEDVSMLPFTID
jgi:hypothetical protein